MRTWSVKNASLLRRVGNVLEAGYLCVIILKKLHICKLSAGAILWVKVSLAQLDSSVTLIKLNYLFAMLIRKSLDTIRCSTI